MLILSVGEDHVDEVPVVGGSCFLQEVKEFDEEGGAVDEGISEGSSSLGVYFGKDGGNGGF